MEENGVQLNECFLWPICSFQRWGEACQVWCTQLTRTVWFFIGCGVAHQNSPSEFRGSKYILVVVGLIVGFTPSFFFIHPSSQTRDKPKSRTKLIDGICSIFLFWKKWLQLVLKLHMRLKLNRQQIHITVKFTSNLPSTQSAASMRVFLLICL